MHKILVIEDEQDICLNILKALEYEGFEAIGAENGRSGVQLAKQHLPDLVICDILMPELSGYGVLIELRRNQQTASIPFIFLTAKTGQEDFQKGIQLGADAYLTKPFDIEELLSVVTNTLLRKETPVSKQLETLRVNLARTLPSGLQAPLTGIIGFSGLLAEFGLDMLPRPNELIAMQTYIYENALRLQRLMADHLLYAELQLMKCDPERQTRWQRVPVMTKELINSAARKKADDVGRPQDLVLDLVDTEVLMFPGSLPKIIDELLENAFTFSAPGTPVRVTTTVDGKRFILSITAQEHRRSEDQFANLDAYTLFEDTPYEHQGQWLELNICRLLAQLHGGELTIERGPNQETTVTIVFN